MTVLKIGLTGGIGSGKSIVASVFSLLGAKVYEADKRARFLMQNDKELIKNIRNLLGDDAYDKQGLLSRDFVANKVFENDQLRQQLNAIVHPAVASDFQDFCESNIDQKYIVKEAAIMFESGSNIGLDKVICVTAPLEIRINRVRLRDNKSYVQINHILNSQMDQEKMLELSDFNILNDDEELVIPQVLSLHRTFLSMSEYND